MKRRPCAAAQALPLRGMCRASLPNKGSRRSSIEMNKNAGVTAFLFSEFFGNYEIGGLDYAFCNSAVIAAGTANGRINATPSGQHVRFNGTVDWMGETYNLMFRLMFPAGGGDPVRVVKRIW